MIAVPNAATKSKLRANPVIREMMVPTAITAEDLKTEGSLMLIS